MRKIFVGGLPKDLPMDVFKNYFGQFGVIEDAMLIKDPKTNKPRGFGFVTYRDVQTVHFVMKNREKHFIRGKWVDCQSAVPHYQLKMPEPPQTQPFP